MTKGHAGGALRILSGAPSGFTTRPVIMGTHGMVTSGHYLASRIGLNILEQGGNAVDAGVAMGFALSVLEPYLYGIGGEVPILIYLAKERRVVRPERPGARTAGGHDRLVQGPRYRRHPG